MADNITVSIKVRPLIKREKDQKLSSQWRIRDNTIANVDGNGEPFVFDHIFDETIRTKELFECVCRPILLSALNGINGTIFAYGQTSSGKTYTMMGDEQELGVVPLTAREIFKEIENSRDRQFLIRVGYIEIYNEKIFDLLDKSNANLKIFENACGDVTLNYKEVITNCPEQIMQHLEEGNKLKRIGDTNMNERSSRSHTIFRITIESSDVGRTEGDENDAVQISTLNLVDLAGSERADQTGATGSRLKEGAHINKSLLSLSCVIQKLSENADNLKYINYRDSKLTRILQASLGGNAVTSMICNITPAALDESYYTLSFAMRAKTIKNKPIVNEVISEAAMMKRLQREIKRLQDELKSEQSKNSKIKTLELQNAITMRANQIINSQTHIQFDKSRRRTWCPSSSGIPRPTGYVEQDNRLMPPPPPFLSSNTTTASGDENSPVIRPELTQRGKSDFLLRKVRSATPNRHLKTIELLDNSDEFIPAELVDFGERSPQSLAREIHTPIGFKTNRRSRRSSAGDSSADYIDYEKRCKELEQELIELQEFTNLEKNLDLANIKQQLHSCEEIRDDLKGRDERLEILEERCKDLEEELRQKSEQIFDMEKELIVARKEREAAVKEAEHCRNLQNSVQVEYELFQQRAKNREKELIECLQEARNSSSSERGGPADSYKMLATVRKELKQLEVHNYELQLQLETRNVELEKLKNVTQEQTEKVGKVRNVLEKDICRKDAKKLFRIITKLRGILAEEDLLINTSIDTDDLVDSIGDASFSESLDRQSPTKIVLTNENGNANVIYEEDNSQMLDMNIENGELKKRVKLLENENKEINLLLKKCEADIEELRKKEICLKEMTEQLELERTKFSGLNKCFQDKKRELAEMTAEYNELSTQVIDLVQDIDGYKDQIERLSQNDKTNEETIKVLQLEKEQLSKDLLEIENEMGHLRAKFDQEAEEHDGLVRKMKDELQKKAEEQTKELNDQVSRFQKELDEKLEKIREVEENNQRLDQQEANWKEQILSIQNELEQKLLLIRELEETKQRLIEQVNEIQEKEASVKVKYEEEQKENAEKESTITELRKEVEKLLEHNSATQNSLLHIQNVLDERSELVRELEETNQRLIEQENKWKEEILSVQKELGEKLILISELEDTKQQLDQQVSEMRKEKLNVEVKYEKEKQEKTSFITEKESTMANLSKEVEKLLELNSVTQKTLSNVQNQLDEKSEIIRELEETNHRLNEQEKNLKEQIMSVQSELETKSMLIGKLEETNQQLNQQIGELRGDKINAEVKYEEDNKEKAAVISEKEITMSTLSKEDEKLFELNAAAEETASLVQKELDDKSDLIRELEETNHRLNEEERKLKEQILSVQNELETRLVRIRELEDINQRLNQQVCEIQEDKMNVEMKYEEEQKEKASFMSVQENTIAELRKEVEKLLELNSVVQKSMSEKGNNLQLDSNGVTNSNEHNSSQFMRDTKSLLNGESSECSPHRDTELQKALIEVVSLRETNKSLDRQLTSLQQTHLIVLDEKKQADEKCESLCNELSRLIIEKEETNDRLALKNEINLLQQAKADLEEETNTLKNQISALEMSIADIGEQKSKLLSKMQTLENEMEESSNIREHLDREVRALKSDLGNLEQQLNENNEKIERYQKQNSEYLQELDRKTDEIERGCQKQKDLQNSIVQLEQKLAEIAAASRMENEWMEKLRAAETCKQVQTVALDKLEAEKIALQGQIEEALTERNFLKQKLVDKDALFEEADQKIASLENQVADLTKKIAQAESNLIAMKQLKEDLNELEKAKLIFHDQIQQVSAERNLLKEQMASRDEQIEQANRQITSLENQVADLKLETEQMELNQMETNKLKDNLEQELNILKSLLLEKQKDCSENTIAVTDLKKIVAELESTVENLRQQLCEKESDFASKQTDDSNQVVALRKQIVELTEQLENINKEHQNDLATEKSYSNKLQQYIQEMERVKLSLQGEKNILEGNYSDLQKTHSNLVEKTQQLEQSNIELDAQLVNLNAELTIREEKLKNVTRELATRLTELDKLQLNHSQKIEEMNGAVTKSTHLNYEMGQQIKALEQDKVQLQDQLKKEMDNFKKLSETEVPSLRSLIKQLEDHQQELNTKLVTNSEELSRKSFELKQTTDLYAQEKTKNAQLTQQMEEAKLMPALQSDGRPSQGDGRVVQALRKENDDLLKQLNGLQKTHHIKTNQLQERIDELREEISTMRHDSSFQEKEIQIVALEVKINHYEQVYEETKNKHRSLQRQNDELRVKHQNLVMEMDDLRRLADRDRRSRRQSTHDDRRGMCFNSKDAMTMTDPTSIDCSCLTMDAQIKDLRKQLTIKECQLNTTKMMAAANPLKNDVVELRRLVKDRESDIFKLQDENRTLSVALDRERRHIDKQCSNCVRLQRMRSLRSDKAVNTDPFENPQSSPVQSKQLEETQEELRKLNSKYQDMKRLCRIRNEKIVSLSQDIAEKENESSVANRSVQQEVSLLKRQLKESEDKYSQVLKTYQTMYCVSKAEKTVQTDPVKSDEVEMIRSKYEKYKNMAIALVEQNEELKRKAVST
ncbi:kinesin-related protein 4-like [Topomyia yanbarensis]|uniref:kinesin-related protein 4-like n=1 Tax=Topomyia yanbarensis TaxID=2498891 RepID=UPI00273AC6BF|nr:kinesin-related protein 4-like [Topomyia yanbarensis]